MYEMVLRYLLPGREIATCDDFEFVQRIRTLRKLTGLKFRIMFKERHDAIDYVRVFEKLFAVREDRSTTHLKKYGALSLSDFDFEIVPDNHDAPESQIISLFTLDYAVLLWFQGELAKERDSVVPASLLHMDWDPEEQRENLTNRLRDVARELPSTHPLHGATIDRVVLSCSDESSIWVCIEVKQTDHQFQNKRRHFRVFCK